MPLTHVQYSRIYSIRTDRHIRNLIRYSYFELRAHMYTPLSPIYTIAYTIAHTRENICRMVRFDRLVHPSPIVHFVNAEFLDKQANYNSILCSEKYHKYC
jgi:hypothetical protein